MSKYSLFRKKAIAVLFASLCICLSFLMIFNAFNVKTVKADSELISVNGQLIDISSFKTYPLAAVRTEATNPGIRFITGINESVYEELTSATADSDWSVKFGTIITYKSRVDAVEDFTKEQLDTLKSSVTQGSVYVDCVAERFLSKPIEEGNKEFTAVLKVDSRNYKNELTARGYMVVSDGTNEQIYYADYEDFSRNTTWVAKTSIENIVTIEDTKSLETLHEYASVGEDGYNMVKTSNVLTNSGFIKPSSVTTSSISVDDFSNRKGVYTFTQTKNDTAWANRLEPALLSPSLSWDGADGAVSAVARQNALEINYLKFDFYYKTSALGDTDFTLYYPTASGEHGTVDFKGGVVSSNEIVKVYNQLGIETSTLEHGNWYTVVVDISCNIGENVVNPNPQVAIVQNSVNNAIVNPQCFDNVIFYRAFDASKNLVKAPTNLVNNNDVISWTAVDGATSYNVKVNQYLNGVLKTEEITLDTNSINISSYGECEVSVQAVNGIGDKSSYSTISSDRSDTLYDFNNQTGPEIVKNETANGYTASDIKKVTYNDDGTVSVYSSSCWANQNFNIVPTEPLDFTNRTGITIRFKVVATGYSSGGDFYFNYVSKPAGPSYTDTSEASGIKVVVGEWQTLTLTKQQVLNYYSATDTDKSPYLNFTIKASSGQSGNPVATILIDDISYIEKIKAPTNLTLNDGVLTWKAVYGATSYNVLVNQYVNGVLTTTNLTTNTNSIDLTAYDECEVSVQAVDSDETSEYSAICSNRTNVLFDFNNQTGPEIASTTTATGYETSVVNSVTYNNDGTVSVKVKSSYNNQNFNIIPSSKELDFKDGIVIRFKVVSSGYAEGTPLTFKFVGAASSQGYNSATNYGVSVTLGEWQTLVLTSEQITASSYYVPNSTNAWKLHFSIVATGGKLSSAVANVVIDDISYIEKIKAPTNLTLNDGLLTWDVVNGATSYNVLVNKYNNGMLTTTNLTTNTNSIDLTEYGECEVSVQAVDGIGQTSAYSVIYSNRTNVIADFNAQSSENSILNSGITNYTNSQVKEKQNNNDGTVTVKAGSDGWKHTNFKVDLGGDVCDLTNNGISIRFKVESTNYPAAASLYLMLIDANANHYATRQNGIEVTVGEWQTLTLTNEQLSSWMKLEWSALFFCIHSTTGLKDTNITVVFDDISYITAE